MTVSHTHSDVYTYCVSGPSAQEVFGSSYSAPVKQSESYKFVGTGNLKQCLEDIQTLFNFTSCEIPENCVNGTFQAPPVNGTVVVSLRDSLLGAGILYFSFQAKC